MSTKIYDAYEFKGSLPQLMKFLLGMRLKVIDAAVEDAKTNTTLNKTTCDESVKMFELARALGSAMGSHQFFEVEKKNKWLIPNLRSSAVVYPVGKRLFVQFFVARSPKEDLGPRFVDYHYQNSTDPWYTDSEYDKKSRAWKKKAAANYRQRRKMWDRIFPKWEAPSQVGLAHDFICDADLMDIAKRVFANIHGHGFMGEDVERARACTLCAMSRKGIKPIEKTKESADAKS